MIRKRDRIAPGPSPRVGFLVYYTYQPLLLPTILGVWQSSHKITKTQHTILINMETRFLEPSDIRKAKINTETDTNISTRQSPSLFFGAPTFHFRVLRYIQWILKSKKGEEELHSKAFWSLLRICPSYSSPVSEHL